MPCHTRQPTSAGLPCHTIVTGGCFQSHRGTRFCYSSILLFACSCHSDCLLPCDRALRWPGCEPG